jgi:uncharacterized protein
LAILLAMSGCSAQGEQAASSAIPARPDGPVLDLANILPPEDEAALDARLRRLWDETGDALVVVSVDSLSGQSIEDYATDLFNTWGIGNDETDRGLLILVAPNQRQVRIGVGCGLESTITDELASDIIQQQIIPRFSEGDLSAGTRSGVDALMERLALPKPANDPGPHSQACKAQARNAA